MVLEAEVGGELAAADAAEVGLGGEGEAFALEGFEVALLAALVEDPGGEVEEGVAVGVGREGVEAAKEGGEAAEGEGGVVGGPAGGLVVEVPEDDGAGLVGGVGVVDGVQEHVDVGLGGGGGGVGGGEDDGGAVRAEREVGEGEERWGRWGREEEGGAEGRVV